MFSFLKRTYLYILAIPVLLITLGAASNQAVMIANHGKFPVMFSAQVVAANKLQPGEIYDEIGHSVMADEDNLKPLADVIKLRNVGTESVGDIMIDLGEWGWAFAPYLWGFAVIRKLEKD